MRLIKPSIEILEQGSGIQGIYKQIEKAGRTCYKSENLITEDSAEKFVNMIKDRQHTAMLEHGTVYLNIEDYFTDIKKVIPKYQSNKYSVTKIGPLGRSGRQAYITTNYRVLIENNWLDDLQYQCEPTKYHEKRITVKFICDRGISHEFVRHRVFSFAQESTRYCNYSKDKFSNELTFIIPCWLDYEEQQFTNKDDSSIRTDLSEHEYFIDLLLEAENTYNYLVKYCEWTPQQARSVLPNALKTELVMTGTLEQWKEFFKLRSPLYGATGAHPQAAELADKLYIQFKEKNYI